MLFPQQTLTLAQYHNSTYSNLPLLSWPPPPLRAALFRAVYHDGHTAGGQFHRRVYTVINEGFNEDSSTPAETDCDYVFFLLCSFLCFGFGEAAGRTRSAAHPRRWTQLGMSSCSWSTPQSNVWEPGCWYQTRTLNHTDRKKKKKTHKGGSVRYNGWEGREGDKAY